MISGCGLWVPVFSVAWLASVLVCGAVGGLLGAVVMAVAGARK